MDARRLGVVTLALLALLAVPGIALALRYVSDPALAHDAIARLDAGPMRAARGVHAWAASFALALVAVHLARAYAAGRMEAPGRAAALAGLAALAVLLLAFFTGTILPWDQQGWEALQHLRGGASVVGIDVPGATPTQAPLSFLFWAHVLAVPVALLALLALHLRRRPDGIARRVAALGRATWIPIAIAAAAVVLLALVAPPALGPAPLEGLVVSRPDWPFLWLVPLQDLFGPIALLALPLALAVGALLLARRGTRAPATRRATLLVATGAWAILTAVGLR